MATISNTPRPGYVWDATDNVWYPIGVGGHGHTDYITQATAVNPTIIDAKGDIITATAADTPARLAVGNNGETLVADSSTATGLRYQGSQAGARNTCINGGFDIWQRGTSFATAANGSTYGPDRWNIFRDPATGGTVSRQASGLTNFLYACRVARDSGNTGTGTIYIWQNFESQMTYPLSGKTIVVSYYARAGANYSPTGSNLGIQFWTGTGVDQNLYSGFTGQTLVVDTAQVITTTWTRYSYTLTLNSNVTQIVPRFQMTPTGTAGANDWFEVTGVQIEVGSVPTTFTRSGGTIQGELAACQRYYQRFNDGGGTATGFANGMASSTTAAYFILNLLTTMRVKPTTLDISTIRAADYNTAYSPSGSFSIYSAGTSPEKVSLGATTFTGLTQYRAYVLESAGSAAAYIGIGAEL